MKNFTSFIAISAVIAGFTMVPGNLIGAINVGTPGDALAPTAPSRAARPGSVTGAIMARGVPTSGNSYGVGVAVNTGGTVNNVTATETTNAVAEPTIAAIDATAINATIAMSSKRYSPITNNELREVIDANGNIVWFDPANDNRFEFDAEGNMRKLPDDPDEYIIPKLGVTVATARRACLGIYADTHQAIFDEAAYQCLIPVTLKDSGKVRQVGGNDVVAWAPMGNNFKCSKEAFENVSRMRKTSHWVVPVMVAGSAGIGAGIGAIMDSNNKRKEEAAAKARAEAERQRNAALEALRGQVNEVGAAVATFEASGNVPTRVMYKGNPYVLNDPAQRKNLMDLLRNDLKPSFDPGTLGTVGTLGTPGSAAPDVDLKDYANKLHRCLMQNFREMTATDICDGTLKLGRIKITRSSDGCLSNGGVEADRLYCWYDAEHAKLTADSQFADCHITGKDGMGRNMSVNDIIQKIGKPVGRFFPEGGCYFRDEITEYRLDRNLYSRFGGSNVFAERYDTTAGSDYRRWTIIAEFNNGFCQTIDLTDLPEFKTVCDWTQNVMNGFTIETKFKGLGAGALRTENTLDGFSVQARPGHTFGEMIDGNPCGTCEGVDGSLPNAPQYTIERLREQYGAVVALINFRKNYDPGTQGSLGTLGELGTVGTLGTMGDLDLDELEKMLASATARIDIVAKVKTQITGINQSIDGLITQTAEETKGKGFFQRNVGKGLLIGTGVGALGGLGYYLWEGSTVSCNVGGLETVKMNQSYNIPSFRDYIVRMGYR
ncbi:MAG: hypothetical protein FWG18_03770 [Alphaproteobacteria bacterium]|nr:hypothetical protein [Alphaproteobacteria bacterium]